MAQKRMFDKSILETDNFLNISLSAKALYFLLGMEADDEGFCSPTRILRLYGGEKGDLKNLIDVGLIIPFKSGVIVITDWNQNNWLDNRRIKPTQYQIEKKMLILTEQKRYELSNGLASAQLEERSTEESRTEQITADADFPLQKKQEEDEVESSTEGEEAVYTTIACDDDGIPLNTKKVKTKKAVDMALVDHKITQDERLVVKVKERSDAGIIAVIDAFKPVNPVYQKWFAIPTQRKASQRLIDIHGLETVLNVIAILPEANRTKYVPTVTTPLQLEDKWASLASAIGKIKIETAGKKLKIIR